MNKFWTMPWAIIALGLITGCDATREAASEPEAKLETGKYEFTYGGQTMGFTVPTKGGPGGKPRIGCVTSGMVNSWPKAMLQDGMPSNGYCAHRNAKRTGNALSGDYVCETDQERAPGGSLKLAYTGDMTDTTTHLDTKMSYDIKITNEMRERDPEGARALEQGGPMLKAITVTIDAKRLGDC